MNTQPGRPTLHATSAAHPGCSSANRTAASSWRTTATAGADTLNYLSGIPVNTPSGARSDGGCLVRRGLNQPMRNLALAHLLLAEAEADRVIYTLCAPDGHPTIWRRLDEVRSAFPDTDRRTIRPLAASVITPLHPDGGNAFHQHYQDLGLTPTFAP